MKGCWVCLPWTKFHLAGVLFGRSDHKGIITGASSTQESLIFWPFQIFITSFPLTVKEQHPQERNVAVWEVAELHRKSQAKPLNLISVSDPLFPAISQLCALKFLEGNMHSVELELSLIPSKMNVTQVICSFLPMHADEIHCVQQYFQTNASYSPLQKQHTHSVLYCFEVVKTKQERTRLFEDHFQEQRINCSAQNGPVIKKKQEEGKNKSKKWRAGENKLVCNRSLTRLLAGPDERHTKQRDWKAKERPKRPLCSAVSWDVPQCWGRSKERSQDVCSPSQHTHSQRSHQHHHVPTAETAIPELSGAEKGIKAPLKRNCSPVTHRDSQICLPLLLKCWLNGHVWFE